jgi:hypothetical protein
MAYSLTIATRRNGLTERMHRNWRDISNWIVIYRKHSFLVPHGIVFLQFTAGVGIMYVGNP